MQTLQHKVKVPANRVMQAVDKLLIPDVNFVSKRCRLLCLLCLILDLPLASLVQSVVQVVQRNGTFPWHAGHCNNCFPLARISTADSQTSPWRKAQHHVLPLEAVAVWSQF